jgi:hypothetical protein
MALAAARQRIADRLATIGGLHVSRYMLSNPTPPAACLLPVSVPADETFDGRQTLPFDCYIFTGSTDLVRAQELLDEYISASGPKSVSTALSADPAIRVIGWRAYGTLLDTPGGGAKLFGAPIRVEVLV